MTLSFVSMGQQPEQVCFWQSDRSTGRGDNVDPEEIQCALDRTLRQELRWLW